MYGKFLDSLLGLNMRYKLLPGRTAPCVRTYNARRQGKPLHRCAPLLRSLEYYPPLLWGQSSPPAVVVDIPELPLSMLWTETGDPFE